MPQVSLRPPFELFSWHEPFLPALKAYLTTEAEEGSDQVLIVPNLRPQHYLVATYAKERYAGVLPRIVPFAEIPRLWLMANHQEIFPHASTLEAAALLHEIVCSLQTEKEALLEQFGTMDLQHFWPWGERLAGLLEEVFRQGKRPQALENLAKELTGPAQALLSSLGAIGEAFQAELARRQLRTQGLDLLNASQNCTDIPQALDPALHQVFVAGFTDLDGAQEKLIHTLWAHGAVLCLHTDPTLQDAHTKLHKNLIARWQARVHERPPLAQVQSKPKLHFFSGYDSHSQLEALRRDLALRAKDPRQKGKTSAILLADSSLLLPLLHHLPSKNINSSLGYPLMRTLLGQFLQILFSLQRRSQHERYYWRDLLHLVRHPYLATLWPKESWTYPFASKEGAREEKPESAVDATTAFYDLIGLEEREEEEQQVQRKESVLATFEEVILNNTRYQNFHDRIGEVFAKSPQLCDRWLDFADLLLLSFAESANLCDMARALKGLLDFLRREVEIAAPIELEAMLRIEQDILPQLCSPLVQKPMSLLLQSQILERLLHEIRLPFAFDPSKDSAASVQVLGLLETRLLHFDTLYFVDAVDELLPGSPSQDPLMPDPLRRVAHLPTNEERAQREAYHVFRLLACASFATFYWQEGIRRSALFDTKNSRSRFVEQLIWEEEQERGAILTPNTEPLETAKAALSSIPKTTPAALVVTEALDAKRNGFFTRGLSATSLDTYLTCPLRFARRHLLNLQGLQEINESDAPGITGEWVHILLKELYTPYLGKPIDGQTILEEEFQRVLHETLKAPMLQKLPSISYYVLETAARVLISKTIHEQAPTTILALEEKLKTVVQLGGRFFRLRGVVDRIDEQEEGLIIYDYKTGSIKAPKQKDLPKLTELATEIEQLRSQRQVSFEELAPSLALLRKYIPSVQLPFYLVLARKELENQYHKTLMDAALVELKNGGTVHSFFGKSDYSAEERYAIAEDLCWLTLEAILCCDAFEPIVGDWCAYCSYRDLCRVGKIEA